MWENISAHRSTPSKRQEEVTLATARAFGSSTRAFRRRGAGPAGSPPHIPDDAAQARDNNESRSSPVFSASAWTTSIKPGASRSSTARVASGVTSLLEKPVPPHVSTNEHFDARSVMAS